MVSHSLLGRITRVGRALYCFIATDDTYSFIVTKSVVLAPAVAAQDSSSSRFFAFFFFPLAASLPIRYMHDRRRSPKKAASAPAVTNAEGIGILPGSGEFSSIGELVVAKYK